MFTRVVDNNWDILVYRVCGGGNIGCCLWWCSLYQIKRLLLYFSNHRNLQLTTVTIPTSIFTTTIDQQSFTCTWFFQIESTHPPTHSLIYSYAHSLFHPLNYSNNHSFIWITTTDFHLYIPLTLHPMEIPHIWQRASAPIRTSIHTLFVKENPPHYRRWSVFKST